jgi:hypothetical protein
VFSPYHCPRWQCPAAVITKDDGSLVEWLQSSELLRLSRRTAAGTCGQPTCLLSLPSSVSLGRLSLLFDWPGKGGVLDSTTRGVSMRLHTRVGWREEPFERELVRWKWVRLLRVISQTHPKAPQPAWLGRARSECYVEAWAGGIQCVQLPEEKLVRW